MRNFKRLWVFILSVSNSNSFWRNSETHTIFPKLESTLYWCIKSASPFTPQKSLSFLSALICNECSLHRAPVALNSLIRSQTSLLKWSEYREALMPSSEGGSGLKRACGSVWVWGNSSMKAALSTKTFWFTLSVYALVTILYPCWFK